MINNIVRPEVENSLEIAKLTQIQVQNNQI